MLDGGLPAWKRAGFPLETRRGRARAGALPCRARRATMVRDFDAGARPRWSREAQRWSTRARRARFRGEAPEPRPGPRLRPHARRPQPALRPAGRRTGRLRAAGEDPRAVPGCRRRSLTSRRNDLRLGRDRGRASLRPRPHRQGRCCALRRLLGRMGLAARRRRSSRARHERQDRRHVDHLSRACRRRRACCRRCRSARAWR